MGVIALGRGTAGTPAGLRRRSRIRCGWGIALIPLAVTFASGLAEVGSLVVQAASVHRGLDAAVSYAARSERPLSAEARGRIRNIVVTGSPDGDAHPLVSGWTKPGADIHIEELTRRVAGSAVRVVRIGLSVPYDPLLGGLMPFPPFNFELSSDRVVTAD